MCIIAVKPAKIAMIDDTIIDNMWYNNDDGAGFMYPGHGGVKIKKGYMTLKSFKKALKALENEIDTTATPIILHFRIGTSGGNIAANTHPFPISENLAALQKTQLTVQLGVVHNGIIDIRPRKKDISDTMEYILSQLAPLYQLKSDFYKTEVGKKLVYNAIQSKMAFLDGDGNVETIGKFETNDGIIYSNSSYLRRSAYLWWDKWDDYSNRWYKASVTKPLQWLSEEDGYIILENGNIIEAYDYLLDDKGQLYLYDEYEDAAVPVTGQALTHAGVPLKYNPDEAIMWEIIK